MIEKDTVRLLRECDAGVKMGISSISDVLDYVHCDAFRTTLTECKADHEKLDREIAQLLHNYRDDGKSPNPMAKAMSFAKTSVKLAMKDSDATIADLMTDGCNMGVKSLAKYLNQYKAADESSKGIAKRLIDLEQKLAVDVQQYLGANRQRTAKAMCCRFLVSRSCLRHDSIFRLSFSAKYHILTLYDFLRQRRLIR